MASGVGNYYEPRLLDFYLGGGSLTPPATVYYALYTAAPNGADASGTEVAGSIGYARVGATNNSTNFPASTGSAPTTKSNGATVTFGSPTGNWGTIVAFALYDAATSGHCIGWGLVTPNKTVNNGDGAPSFAIGALTVTLA